MKLAYSLLYFLFFSIQNSLAYEKILLWDQVSSEPNKIVDFSKDPKLKSRAVLNVTTPDLQFVPPEGKTNHSAVLIVPGGGFTYIMMDYEGLNVAKELSKRGYSSFVLTYRMPANGSDKKRNQAFADVQRSIRLIRSQAKKYNIAENSIGVMGFSAGAYLAANVANKPDFDYYPEKDSADKLSARPNFSAFIYPVLSMLPGITHNGTKNTLWGTNNDCLAIANSQEYLVSKNSPPVFLAQALDDQIASPKNTLRMFDAVRNFKGNVEMHLFHEGGHGFSTAVNKKLPVRNWINLFSEWQKAIK